MIEYIIEWSGICTRIVELMGEVTPSHVAMRLRKERLREPIVRCRDCVHCEIGWCCWFKNIVKPDGFCAWAERRADA